MCGAAPVDQPAESFFESPPSSPQKFDRLAIAALIAGVLFGLVGVVLGTIAIGRIKKSHAKGRSLAIAGITAGLLTTVVSISIFMLPTTTTTTGTGSTIAYDDGWNAAKDYYSANGSTRSCDYIYSETDWIPVSEYRDSVFQGCIDWNAATGEPDYLYPSNHN